MNKFYIHDTTIGKFVYFNTVKELVNYLKNYLIPRATNNTSQQFIQHLIDLGHGYDDEDGVMITRAISEKFDIGVVKDNKHLRTDIHSTNKYSKEGYGD